MDDSIGLAEGSPNSRTYVTMGLGRIVVSHHAFGDALDRLEKSDPLKVQLIEMRYFGGMTAEESAGAVAFRPRGPARTAPGSGLAAERDRSMIATLDRIQRRSCSCLGRK